MAKTEKTGNFWVRTSHIFHFFRIFHFFTFCSVLPKTLLLCLCLIKSDLNYPFWKSWNSGISRFSRTSLFAQFCQKPYYFASVWSSTDQNLRFWILRFCDFSCAFLLPIFHFFNFLHFCSFLIFSYGFNLGFQKLPISEKTWFLHIFSREFS